MTDINILLKCFAKISENSLVNECHWVPMIMFKDTFYCSNKTENRNILYDERHNCKEFWKIKKLDSLKSTYSCTEGANEIDTGNNVLSRISGVGVQRKTGTL